MRISTAAAATVFGACLAAAGGMQAARAQTVGDIGRQLLQQVVPGQQPPGYDRDRDAYERGRQDAAREQAYRDRAYRDEDHHRREEARHSRDDDRRRWEDAERHRRDTERAYADEQRARRESGRR